MLDFIMQTSKVNREKSYFEDMQARKATSHVAYLVNKLAKLFLSHNPEFYHSYCSYLHCKR